MGTPEENFETAVDQSSDSEARERAIDTLETANACGELADIVRKDGLDDRYREQALTSLAHPQCKATLETLAEDGELEESLRDRAESLLEETTDSAGAGP